MPSAETILVEAVPTGGQVILSVPGLRLGVMEEGTGAVTVGGFPQPEVSFGVDFDHEEIHLTNDGPSSWAKGAKLVAAWSGTLPEGEVAEETEDRIMALEDQVAILDTEVGGHNAHLASLDSRVAKLEANLGVTDGSDVTDGMIGQYITRDNITGYNLNADTPTEIVPIILPPGCWDIWGSCDFSVLGVEKAPPIQPNSLASSISLHVSALPSEEDLISGTGVMNLIYSPLASGQRQVLGSGTCRSNSATQVNLYLVAHTGMANINVKGYISARRVR